MVGVFISSYLFKLTYARSKRWAQSDDDILIFRYTQIFRTLWRTHSRIVSIANFYVLKIYHVIRVRINIGNFSPEHRKINIHFFIELFYVFAFIL